MAASCPGERVRMACGYRELSPPAACFELPAAERAVLRTASVLRGCRLVPVPPSVLDLAAAWVAANQEPLLQTHGRPGLPSGRLTRWPPTPAPAPGFASRQAR